MAPYSMDLRERVARAWDTSGDAEEVAATFGVSRAWVHRLVQRRRETGSLAPRQQTKFRSRVLADGNGCRPFTMSDQCPRESPSLIAQWFWLSRLAASNSASRSVRSLSRIAVEDATYAR